MRRLGSGLVAAALVVAFVGIRVADAESAPAARRSPRPVAGADRHERRPAVTSVAVFGDSLTYQARPTLEARLGALATDHLTLSTRPGAALCDDRAAIVDELLSRRPEVLVLEYSGNSYTDCMRGADGSMLRIGSAAWRDRYLGDLRIVLNVAALTETSVRWTTAPAVRHAPDPDDYPARLAAAVEAVATERRGIRVVDTGGALSARRHEFDRTLPCGPAEQAFCEDGRITVRADDGLHFDCYGFVDPLGGCIGYSAGAHRFGDAIADAALAG